MKQSSLHIAIIMDGNGRWANRCGLPRFAGHQAGAEALRAVIEAAPSCGIAILTAYAFSSDNWKRPSEEVNSLMTLMAGYLEEETPRLLANGVRFSAIGRRDRLPSRLLTAVTDAEAATAGGTGLHLRLAIDYSARDAILRAAKLAAGQPLTPEAFEKLLGGSKPVDLLIRTGGEQRLSDFLLWECAYAELVFTQCMWPEFDTLELRKAVSEFYRRDRRFGAVGIAHEPEVKTASAPFRDRWLH
jgi:undecaprenyl diphosphate synthase